MLMVLHKMYEPITEWELQKAKLHANEKGPGVRVEKPIYHRVRLDTVKVNHFLLNSLTGRISIKTLRMEHAQLKLVAEKS